MNGMYDGFNKIYHDLKIFDVEYQDDSKKAR